MPDRQPPFTFLLLAMSCVLVTSCARGARSTPTGPSRALTPMGQHIDVRRIRASGAATAWDLLTKVAPFQASRLRSTPTRRPETAAGSGRAGLLAARVMLNGAPVVDPGILRAIPAADVISIDLLGSLDAVSLFGQSYGGGAIVIRTQRR